MEDSKDWPTIRAFHALVLTYIERGLLNWEDRAEILMLRQKYVFALKSAEKSTLPCPDFNRGFCSQRSPHDGLIHVCAYCLAVSGKPISNHGQNKCMKLHGRPPREPSKQGEEKKKSSPWLGQKKRTRHRRNKKVKRDKSLHEYTISDFSKSSLCKDSDFNFNATNSPKGDSVTTPEYDSSIILAI